MSKTQSTKLRKNLYLMKYQNSVNWYAVYRSLIDGKYDHRKSTRTSDFKEATKRAEDFWIDWKLAARGEKSLPQPRPSTNPPERFDRIVDDFLDELKRDAGDDLRKLRRYRDKKQLCYAPNGFTAFFGKDNIKDIKTARIAEFLRFQVENSKKGKLSSRTQKGALIELGLVFKYAVSKGLLASVPIMPRVRLVRTARSWFNVKEYERLLIKARELAYDAMKAGNQAEVQKWREILDFVQFMVGSFLRASEWASLKHRHIEVVKDRDNAHLKIAVIKGKTMPRYTISMPWLVNTYDRIVERNRLITRADLDPDGYVFLPEYPNRDTASTHMRQRFGQLLEATGLKVDALGQNRVTHCLRHSAIMFRLLEGVDSLVLAKNAGTSVEQIELHYASQFKAEMKLGELHKTGVRVVNY